MKTGTNLTGGDTAWQDWSGSMPVFGTHYLFVSTQDIDYLLNKGCNTFRLVFGWEAIQPTPYATIPSTISNHATYFNKMKAVVDYITSKGAEVVIDIHDGRDVDFAAYYGVKVGGYYNGSLVGNLLVDFWKKLATIFKSNLKVSFGITNEPHDIAASTWYSCAQLIVNGIRSVGAPNLIVMPGVDWTGAGSWMTNNATAWKIEDPLNNTAIQVHLYADVNGGGGDTSIQSATVLADRMAQVTTWARSKGLKVLVGEVGISAANALAPTAWKNFVDFCNANSDTIMGFLFWSYGPPSWWGGFRFTLCPTSNYTVDSPQMKMIASSLSAPVPADPTVAQLQAQIATLTQAVSDANKLLTAKNAEIASLRSTLDIANSNLTYDDSLISKIKALLA